MTHLLRPLRCRAWRQTILAGFAGLVLGSLLGCTLILWTNHTAPTTTHDTHGAGGLIPHGSHFTFRDEAS